MAQLHKHQKMEPPDTANLVGDSSQADLVADSSLADLLFSSTFMTSASYAQWCDIGIRHHLQSHLEILLFLLKWYNTYVSHTACRTCGSFLSYICINCSSHQASHMMSCSCGSAHICSSRKEVKPEQEYRCSDRAFMTHNSHTVQSAATELSQPHDANTTWLSGVGQPQHSLPAIQEQSGLVQVQSSLSLPPMPPLERVEEYGRLSSAGRSTQLTVRIQGSNLSAGTQLVVDKVNSRTDDQTSVGRPFLDHSPTDPLQTELYSSDAATQTTSRTSNLKTVLAGRLTVPGGRLTVPGGRLRVKPRMTRSRKRLLSVASDRSLRYKYPAAAGNHCGQRNVPVSPEYPSEYSSDNSDTDICEDFASDSGVADGSDETNKDPGIDPSRPHRSPPPDQNALQLKTEVVNEQRFESGKKVGNVKHKRRKATKAEMVAKKPKKEDENLTPEETARNEEMEKVLDSLYCAKCDKKYSCRKSLKNHLELSKAHGGPGNVPKTQQNRPKLGVRAPKRTVEEYFQHHYNDVEDYGDGSFRCLMCTKIFTDKIVWRRHHRDHKFRIKTLCPVCGIEVEKLRLHLLYHKSDKPHKCPYCPAAYVVACKLREHIQIHTKEKNYCCEVCGRRFRLKQDLIRHGSVHSEQKQFRCQQCGDSFARNRGLKDHMRVHTGEKPYACQVCDRKFSSSGNLAAHRRKVHRLEPMVGGRAPRLMLVDF